MTQKIEMHCADAVWEDVKTLYRPGLVTRIEEATIGRLPKAGLNFVAATMLEPSRNVESTPRSGSGRYPSRKIGRVISFESATIEYPTVQAKERDASCIALFDQPRSLKIHTMSGGRRVGYNHTPDFLCIEASRVVLIECKSLDGIKKKNERIPGFFVYEDGRYKCPAAQQAAAALGIEYEVWTELNLDAVTLRNAMYIDAYLCGATHVYDAAATTVMEYMRDKSEPRSILTLLRDLAGQVNIDGVHAAIARGVVAFDMSSTPLANQSACELFRDEDTLRAFQLARAKPLIEPCKFDAGVVQIRVGTQLMWNAVRWRCVRIADSKVTLAPNADVQPTPLGAMQPLSIATVLLMVNSGEMTPVDETPSTSLSNAVASMLQAATLDHLQEANRRLSIILQYLGPRAPTCQDRSIRRYIKSYRDALHELGNGYVGLLPRWRESGNRNCRIIDAVGEVVRKFINERYLTPDRPSALSVYREILGAIQIRGYVAPSYRWFMNLINSMPKFEVELARKGRKGAYRLEPRVECVDRNARPIAERAFELAHIDHTLIDVAIDDGKTSTRMWLTLMICGATRRVLAFALSFEPPSYRHVMLVLRECVRRHHRLPEGIMVDGGKEFGSVWFETLCAVFHVTVRRRPKSKARFGAQIERLFGTANSQLFHTLVANTQNTRNVRQLTPEIDPYRHSIWTKEAIKRAIARYFFEDYDQRTHTSLLVSPRQAFEASQALHGSSPHRFVSFDETFLILTSATTKAGKARVQPDGVKINYLYYNHPTLRFHLEKDVPVRFDPFNLANAWAHVDGSWLKLTSRYASVLINHSEHDVGVVTEAWRQRRSAVEAQALADTHLIRLLQDLRTEEEWLAQRQLSIAERDLRSEDGEHADCAQHEAADHEAETACEVAPEDVPMIARPETAPVIPPAPRRLRLTRQLREVEVL